LGEKQFTESYGIQQRILGFEARSDGIQQGFSGLKQQVDSAWR
jgi:hypothetical protein